MERNNEYTLTTGQFAKLCKTTRDTLRYYQEVGLLIPYSDPNTGYHYYSMGQVSSFYIISIFKQSDCSIQEIKGLMNNCSKEKLKETTNNKLIAMKNEMRSIRNKMASLQTALWLIESFDEHKNLEPFVDVIPHISIAKTAIANKENAYHAVDVAMDLLKHLDFLSNSDSISVLPTGSTISYEDFLNQKYVYNNIISISLKRADNKITFPLPSYDILGCYQDHSESIEVTYAKLRKYISDNKIKVCSDLHIISLINLYDASMKHTYFKYLFFCIEKN